MHWGNFQKIWYIQIKIYLQTSIDSKACEFYFQYEVSACILSFFAQLSCKVTPPFSIMRLMLSNVREEFVETKKQEDPATATASNS